MSELIYNGRSCRHCGCPIARPTHYDLRGFKTAVICDHCWELAASWYLAGTKQAVIARTLGVDVKVLHKHLIGYGLKPDSEQVYREATRRTGERVRQRRAERRREETRQWKESERGRQIEHSYRRTEEYRDHHREYARSRRQKESYKQYQKAYQREYYLKRKAARKQEEGA